MCCCDKPTVNGEPGYKWQPTDNPSVRPPQPPAIMDGDVLLFDEPGRCGGIDSHSHHYRVVQNCGLSLLVRHGGGDERIRLSLYKQQPEILLNLSSSDRYWILNAIYHAYSDGKKRGSDYATEEWQTAAIEKRIKTRKAKGYNSARAWIETQPGRR